MRFGPLVIAVILALAAGFITLKMMGGSPPPEQTTVQIEAPAAPAVETVNVYIAARYIPIGAIITSDMLSPQPWPRNLAVETFITDAKTANALVGQIARASFQQGEPLSLTKIASASDGSFLAGDLPKGMRAITINTDETLGVAGFVFPGDKVDVLITHRVPRWDALRESAAEEDITETLLSNVTVLATDQIASVKEPQKTSAVSPSAPKEESSIHIPRTVSLMVTPEDTHKLRLGERVGQLSLALRSAKDKDTVDFAALTRRQNITQFPLDSIVRPKTSRTGGGAEGATSVTGDGVRIVRGIAVSESSPLDEKKPLPPLNNPLQLTSLAPSATLPQTASQDDAGTDPAPVPTGVLVPLQ